MPVTEIDERDRGSDPEKERVTIRLPKGLLEHYESLVGEGDLYRNRSDALRAGLRAGRDAIDDRGSTNAE